MNNSIGKIGIGWEIGVPSGWGMYGLNLAVDLMRRGIDPALFFVAHPLRLSPAQADALKDPLARHPAWHGVLNGQHDFPVLLALGDGLEVPDVLRTLRGRPTIGVVFCEHAVVPEANLALAAAFGGIITGSSWNTEILRGQGLAAVRYCPQGIDTTLFRPGPRPGKFPGRFTVFTGGKLEYRKGQDLVIAAFKRFRVHHPEALLVCAWHSPWPDHAREIAKSPHVKGAPPVVSGQLDIPAWLTANGLPADSFVDLGAVAHTDLPAVLADMDAAVMPSRCEGGTNLVAMECMAMGVPVVLSRNTGHLDLISGENCYPLDFQIPMGEITGRADLDGWGESSIDEIVTKLEAIYADHAGAARRGAAGAAFMRGWDWATQVGLLLDAVIAFS